MNLHRIEYRYAGQVYATVIEARSLADAIAAFKAENPHVEVITTV